MVSEKQVIESQLIILAIFLYMVGVQHINRRNNALTLMLAVATESNHSYEFTSPLSAADGIRSQDTVAPRAAFAEYVVLMGHVQCS